MDIPAIAAAIEAAKSLYEWAVGRKDNALAERVGDLQLKIMGITNELATKDVALRTAEERVRELEETVRFKEELKFKDGFYFCDGDEWPYCATCWENNSKPVHMRRYFSTIAREYRFLCEMCKPKKD